MLATLVCVLAACADVIPVKDFNLEKVTKTHLKRKKEVICVCLWVVAQTKTTPHF